MNPTVERRSGQFEEFLSILRLHLEAAIEHKEVVWHFADFSFLKIVLIQRLRRLG